MSDVDRGPLVVVDDPADPRLADYRDLNDAALRRRHGTDDVVVVEGRVAVGQLLATPSEVCSLLVDDHQVTAAATLVAGVRARGAPVYVASRAVVAATVGFALHRGVVAIARRPPAADLRGVLAVARRHRSLGGGPSVVAVCEDVNDHENLGALFRNAAAFGVGAVLLSPTCADPFYRRAVRVSVGHVLRVPSARVAPWPDGLDTVRAAGFVLAALAPARSAASVGRRSIGPGQLRARLASADAAVAVLLGAEGPGLSPEVLAVADEVVSVPTAAEVDSLNVATAAAVVFHRLADR